MMPRMQRRLGVCSGADSLNLSCARPRRCLRRRSTWRPRIFHFGKHAQWVSSPLAGHQREQSTGGQEKPSQGSCGQHVSRPGQ